uniref:Uncharacterized protein n=1 Tax=Chromera velia CCMP2878 TaxID=1169474 RepID=A0A0G4FDI6_9ALVE|eukprot:Cvel_16338.t1-p1 / transcript=Cvel_16338.t1 / gene=Cvel_16338 / organism=Chromera_velia_CCMP2878 / gene_product=hypothetical protein / transcript_product=hypothetical protein / location=Cvel_scaffold1254:11508-12482(+) / protein_length=154 / sequence_SO=supercontig / SO=protein_coding / is_pseudo=false
MAGQPGRVKAGGGKSCNGLAERLWVSSLRGATQTRKVSAKKELCVDGLTRAQAIKRGTNHYYATAAERPPQMEGESKREWLQRIYPWEACKSFFDGEEDDELLEQDLLWVVDHRLFFLGIMDFGFHPPVQQKGTATGKRKRQGGDRGPAKRAWR